MAKYANGTSYAGFVDPTGANRLDPGTLGGKLRVMVDTGVVTTQLSSSNYILVGKELPTGAQVLSIIVGGDMTAFASSSNIDVGDEGDANRYMSSVSCAADVVTIGPNAIAGMNYSVTGTTDNIIRLTPPSGCAVSSGNIKIAILYAVE